MITWKSTKITARSIARSMGHDLGKWEETPNSPYLIARCRDCNKMLKIYVSNSGNMADTKGEAMYQKCEGK